MKIAVIGCGLAGKALGRVLAGAGNEIVAVTCREEGRAREAAAFVGAKRGVVDPNEAAAGAGLVLLCVPDRAI
ncbi:MAG: NAD(P)-binding domain-containing protein, partial [Planctomycetota bacterium]